MTRLQLSIRSAAYYWRAHVGALAGTAIAGAVLVGAMLVGDSVKYSLRQSALLRLGGIHHVLGTQGRFFRQDLADRLAKETGAGIAPILLLRGIALTQDNAGSEPRQVNNVQVVGVDGCFAGVGGSEEGPPGDNEVAVNAKLAAALGLKTGDSLSVRIGEPSLFPRDAALSLRAGDDTRRWTFTVRTIVADAKLGRFSLAANQVVPFNAFVNLKWLQNAVNLQGRANFLLADGRPLRSSNDLGSALRKVWRIEDAGLTLREVREKGIILLESDRVFMDPPVSGSVLVADEGKQGKWQSVGTLTYLVNSISFGTNSTPYSFMAAMSPSADRGLGPVPQDMADDEIILNRWLADCLSARTGGTVRVEYYELSPANKFIERSREFRVRSFVEMASIAGERELGPKFPGLTDVERCADWDIGMPLDKAKVADKANEAYWENFRATPKAFVTLKAGQDMWANRFGNLSGVRYPAAVSDVDTVAGVLKRRLDPSIAGLVFVPVREHALKAAGEALDFGQLFLGMSFFLVVAALMLVGLLFSFGVQQRSAETGVLLAVGYRPANVRRLLMTEGCFVAGMGAVVGALLGALYTRLLIWGLTNFWQGAVANSAIQYHVEPLTILEGAVACFVCAIASMAVAMRRQSARPARELLSGGPLSSPAPAAAGRLAGATFEILPWVGVMIAGVIITVTVVKGTHDIAPAFFAAGALLLLSGLGLARLLLIRLERVGGKLSITSLGVRNAGRRRARSLTVTGLLACGCFMVFAVSSMREDFGADALLRSSGTGGFSLYGEATLPVQDDLNSHDGRKKLRLDGEVSLENAAIVSIKVHDGDDASCLNLNRAQSPRLLGVDPGDFAVRKAFMPDGAGGVPWDLLNERLPDGVVPGLAGDKNTAMWGLGGMRTGVKDGDTLTCRDERGGEFKVKLVGSLPMKLSVFQGSVLIPAGAFTEKYPSENGYRIFLVDTPGGKSGAVADVLARRLEKYGLDLVPAVDRLREFYAVESTYMAVFLMLGGLGLILGSAGMGIVVARNILERRSEIGLLKAVGYSDSQLRRVLLLEHWIILALGFVIGVVSSFAAMWPSLTTPGVRLPYGTILILMTGVALFNVLVVGVSVLLSNRGSPVEALRSE